MQKQLTDESAGWVAGRGFAIYDARCIGHFRSVYFPIRFEKQARHITEDLESTPCDYIIPRRLEEKK